MRPDLLIVDDLPDQIQLLSTVLRAMDPDLKIRTAGSGDEALRSLKSDQFARPKVILLDVRMPGKSGHEVLKEFKSDAELKAIPICMYSTSELESDVCEAYKLGASAYFKKPTGLEDLRFFAKEFKSVWFQLALHCQD